MKFAEPSKENVCLEDFVVDSDKFSQLYILPIIEVDNYGVVAGEEDCSVAMRYEDSVILKKNGTYLIGNRAGSRNTLK